MDTDIELLGGQWRQVRVLTLNHLHMNEVGGLEGGREGEGEGEEREGEERVRGEGE